MTDIVLYRMTSAEPVDGPLITLSGVPVRAHSVEVAPLYDDLPDISPHPPLLIGRRGGMRALDVTLRVLPGDTGQVATAYVQPARPHSAKALPDGGYIDADGADATLEVWETPESGRVVLILNGNEITLDDREVWSFLTEVAAIAGRHRETDDA